MKEHSNRFPTFLEFVGIKNKEKYSYVAEIDDALKSGIPLPAEMRNRMQGLIKEPSTTKADEWKKLKPELLSEMFETTKKQQGVNGQIEKAKDINELIAKAKEMKAPVVVAGVNLAPATGFITRTQDGLIFVGAAGETRALINNEIPQAVRELLEKKLPVSIEPRVIYLLLSQDRSLVDEAGKVWQAGR